MITVLPADKGEVAVWAAQEQNSLAEQGMVLRDNGQEKGHALFAIKGSVLYIGDIVCEDSSLKDGLLRSVVNIGWNHTLETVVYTGKKDRAFLETYGFSDRDGQFGMTVAAFFHCGCKKEE